MPTLAEFIETVERLIGVLRHNGEAITIPALVAGVRSEWPAITAFGDDQIEAGIVALISIAAARGTATITDGVVTLVSAEKE